MTNKLQWDMNTAKDNRTVPPKKSSAPVEPKDHVDKTAHHSIAVILKEIACSPMPNVDRELMETFDTLPSADFNRKNLTNILKKKQKAADVENEEHIADLVQKLEAYRGYNRKKIKLLLEKIQNEHGYSIPQMTRMLEKLNESDHYTVIHYAALFNNVPFCECLVEDYKCNVNLVGWDGETPLHIAARSADIKVADTKVPDDTVESSIFLYLLSTPDIKVDMKDSQGRSPLHLAIMYDCFHNVKHLINQLDTKQLKIADIQGATPLHYACRFHDTQKMVSLFKEHQEHEELFNCKTLDGMRPLDTAAEYGNLEIVKALFERSKSQPSDNKTLNILISAAVRPREDKVLSYLKDKNMLIDHHHTTLHFACRQLHGHKLISHLINHASIMYQDKQDGFSPLMVAVKHRQLGCVEELLSHNAWTEEAFELTSPNSLLTVLHICAEVNEDNITTALMKSRRISSSLIGATDLMGNTALHICAKAGNAYMTQLLLFPSTPVVPISKTPPPPRSMTNLDSNGRVLQMSTWSTPATVRQEVSANKHVEAMLTKKNKDKLTPLHLAIQSGKLNVITEMLKVSNSSSIINACDDQRRTSLHMAAEKGHDDIVKLLLNKDANVHACDINDWTPLHDAARCSTHPEDNIKRTECIRLLVKDGMAHVDALNIRRDTPLHIACEYGSSQLATRLLKLGADMLATNVDGYNCLEVAIEHNNEEVVKFLIEDENAFDLMRNAQVKEKKSGLLHRFVTHYEADTPMRNAQVKEKKSGLLHRFVTHYEADTPMRKLIRKMPKMALRMLDKCTMTVGTDGTDVHKQVYIYEFLDDQYTIKDWQEGNFGTNKITDKASTLYTSNEADLVMNHPLFLMASCEAADLMSHRLSSRLVSEKFQKFGIFIFVLFILFYAVFLALFTTIVLRTGNPQIYYNLTNFDDFNDALCYNVSQELIKGTSGVGGKKSSADYILKYAFYVIIWLHIAKNLCVIVEVSRVHISKTASYVLEMIALIFGFIFAYDQSYQMDLTFRCPTQWQYGAFGILISWIALLHYVQFMPVIGLYVAMLSVILRRFMNFLLVIIILISGFALSFHMLFQNFAAFENSALSYIKTALMIAGEFDFDDYMFNDNKTAYYKLAYLIYIMFAVVMTILVTNLLIGLAVGEIPPLMKQAGDHRNKLFFELVADFEIARYQLAWFSRRHKMNDAIAYSYRDLDQKKWYQQLKRWVLKCILQKNDDDQSDPSTEEQIAQQTGTLQKLNEQVYVLTQQTKPSLPMTTIDIDKEN